MNNKGILIVFSGPSGCGKGTVLSEFLKDRKNVFVSVSATTRSPRPGEVDGKHYYFLTKEDFEKKISQNGMLEYANYCGNYYGTPKKEVFDRLENGYDVILEIEVNGAKQIKEKCENAVLIFVAPPSIKELNARLSGRNTEDEQTIKNRIRAAFDELKCACDYDYIIVNDEVKAAAGRLENIIEASRYNKINMKEYVNDVLNAAQAEIQ